MSSMWGNSIRIQIFGESHGGGIGVVMDGMPSGEAIDLDELQAFMARRAPGQGAYSTARKETDAPEILSGLLDGHTTGAPLAALIRNGDTRSKDYSAMRWLPRPGHADYTAEVRYNGAQDTRGGGHFSGRLTAPLCVAGGIAKQILARRGIFVGAHLLSVGSVWDCAYNRVGLTAEELLQAGKKAFPVMDEAVGQRMLEEIEAARLVGDSVGGRIEAAAIGVPAGWGDPMFGGVENRIASLMFGIPAIRGIEFGYGMGAAELRGSEHNDPFTIDENGQIVTKTNNHGGILGGITSGMPIIVKVAVKPTPSIVKEQDTVNMQTHETAKLSVPGRHDPCIAPRAVPVVEAALAIALLDLWVEFK